MLYVSIASQACFHFANLTQVGWVVPFLWAGIWAAITIQWVKRDLKREYDEWTTAQFKL
jgi:hypothetical protein